MSRWKDEPWATDPQVLIGELETLYTAALKAGRFPSPEVFTAEKVRHYRGWHACVPQEDIVRAVTELEAVYVPSGRGPGPGICFPIRDMTREVMRLHIRLLEDRPAFYRMNYMSIVNPDRFIGPAWIGADDLLAVRALSCPIPSLCSTNKSLTEDHWDFLRVFGVKRVIPLLDNEYSGVGSRAATAMFKNPYKIEVIPCTCPVKDPSAALTKPLWVSMLRKTFSLLRPNSLVLEEDQ